MKTNNKLIIYTESRSPKVSTWSHHCLEKGLFFVSNLNEIENFFPFGNGDSLCPFKDLPSLLSVNSVFTRIDSVVNCYLCLLKKLLSFFTRSSSFAKVCPINRHFFLPIGDEKKSPIISVGTCQPSSLKIDKRYGHSVWFYRLPT